MLNVYGNLPDVFMVKTICHLKPNASQDLQSASIMVTILSALYNEWTSVEFARDDHFSHAIFPMYVHAVTDVA